MNTVPAPRPRLSSMVTGRDAWSRPVACGDSCLPAGLGDAGQLAGVRHGPQADTAEAELAVHRVRTAALLAPGVAPHLELGLAVGLVDQSGLRHDHASLKGKPSSLSSVRPSSSFFAVVTTVMSMPRTRSIRSWSISWNIDCSVRPKV